MVALDLRTHIMGSADARVEAASCSKVRADAGLPLRQRPHLARVLRFQVSNEEVLCAGNHASTCPSWRLS